MTQTTPGSSNATSNPGLDFSELSASARLPKIFTDPRHNTQANLQAWLDGINAAAAGDARGVLQTLSLAKGSARLLNKRGKPARNPIASKARLLQASPHAWARLMDSQPSWQYSPDPSDFPEANTYIHDATDIEALLWAIKPSAVAEAATLWRADCERTSKWPIASSPFFGSVWDGPIELSRWLAIPARRHFGLAIDLKHNVPPRPNTLADALPADSEECKSMATILEELARASIEELFAGHRQAAKERAEHPERQYSINHSWATGLRWREASFDIAAPDASPLTPLMAAVDSILRDALAISAKDFSEKVRLVALACAEGGQESLSMRALSSWLRAHPDDPRGLPLLPSDWLRPSCFDRILPKTPESDKALGRWFARAGKSWRAPATFGYSSRLEVSMSYCGAPSIYIPEKLKHSISPSDLAAWTVVEWLFPSRPEAVREACLDGYHIVQGFEQAMASDTSGFVSPSRLPQSLAMAEACRLASSTLRSDDQPKRRRSI